jgi:hypothetical protein
MQQQSRLSLSNSSSRPTSYVLRVQTGTLEIAEGPLRSTAGDVTSVVLEHIREGRFQRSMSLVAAGSSLVSGIEIAYEHYKGSYSNPVMYSPVILSGVLTIAGVAGVFSGKAARTLLRVTSFITLLDGATGFVFHVRGITRKPGGWRVPVANIVMGPPVLAPLLFGTAAYLGFIASYLRREDEPRRESEQEKDAHAGEDRHGWRRELQEGRFQKHLAIVSAAWAMFSGFEALYSHYKSKFRIWAQWTPVVLTPVQVGACAAAVYSERAARTLLPAASALTTVDGMIGFGYHARGILRRPGGRRTWLYNILYGPPIFAPLLFSACGMLGLLASVLRREGK